MQSRLTFGLAIATTALAAQWPREIELRGEPGCSSCRVTLGAPVTLQTAGDADVAYAPTSLARDRRGFIYLLHEGSEAGPLVFDSTGRYTRTLGRSGDGPGEYRYANVVIVDAHDSLHVIDTRARRHSVLAPAPSWSYVRGLPAAPHPRVALLTDGRLVSSGNGIGAGDQPLHWYGSDGIVKGSFGSEVPLLPTTPPALFERSLGSSRRGFWAADVLQYRVAYWQEPGSPRLVLRRVVDWFPARAGRQTATADQPPSPEITAVREDAEGLLWVLSIRAGRNWRASVGTPRAAGGRGWGKLDRIPQRLYETVIEVIDPARPALLAALTVEGYFPFFLDDRHIGGYATNEDQLPVVMVRAISLRR